MATGRPTRPLRRLLAVAGVIEALLLLGAQLDIGLRAPNGVRGEPARWRLIALAGWAGRLTYFRFGRIRWDRFGVLRPSPAAPAWLDRLVHAGAAPVDDAPQPMVAPDRVTTRLGEIAVHRLGAGRTAVLWHSLYVDGSSWGWTIPALLPGRRLLIVDGPGWGRSDRLTHRVPAADVIGAAIDVLRELAPGESVDWVGNGWGGRVGIELAAARPDLVRSLVTIETPVGALRRADRARGRALTTALFVLGPIAAPVRRPILAGLLTDAVRREPDVIGAVLDAIALAGQRSAAFAVRSFGLVRRDLTPLLHTIASPGLLIAGGDDPAWTAAEAHDAAASMPNARAVAVPDSRALAPLESPQLVGTLIADFWATLDAAERTE